jgi:hypothetical protein
MWRILVAVGLVVACKSHDKACSEARGKAQQAWLAVMQSEYALSNQANERVTAATAVSAKISADTTRIGALYMQIGCVRTNSIVTLRTVDGDYLRGAAKEALDSVTAARALAKETLLDEASRAKLVAAAAEVEKAEPELEAQLKATKGNVVSPALDAAARKVAKPCSELFMIAEHVPELETKAIEAAGTEMKAKADAALAEQRAHNELLNKAGAAATAVGELPNGNVNIAPELAGSDARFVPAQHATAAAFDECK